MTSTLIISFFLFFVSKTKGWMFIWKKDTVTELNCPRVIGDYSAPFFFFFFFLVMVTNSSDIIPFCRTFKSSMLDVPRLVNEFVSCIFPGHHFTKTLLLSCISLIALTSILKPMSFTSLVDCSASTILLLSMKVVTSMSADFSMFIATISSL